jgi:hypothetical protein
MAKQPSITSAQDKLIAGAYFSGKSQRECAELFGYSRSIIICALKRQRVKLRKSGGQLGELHGNWSGGKLLGNRGYIYVRITHDDPMWSMCPSKGNSTGYILEHRLVIARFLGRPLTDKETVHHINGDRTDNRIENLQLRNGRHGPGASFCCADCGSINIIEREI